MASTTFLQKAYLAYFGRPADASGLITFANVSEAQVIASFSASPESQEFFGSMPLLEQINTIYNNLFNRDAEPAGLLHWATKIQSGELTLAAAAMVILSNAQNSDVTAVANKLAASAAFTAAVDTTPEILGYAGADAIAPARAFLASVTSDPATLTAATKAAALDASVAGVVDAGTHGANAGQTFMLTAGVDQFTGAGERNTIKVWDGVGVGGSNTTNAVTVVGADDVIDGGAGTDTLNWTATVDHNNELVGSFTNIELVNITGADNIGGYNAELVAAYADVDAAQAGVDAADAGVDAAYDVVYQAAYDVDAAQEVLYEFNQYFVWDGGDEYVTELLWYLTTYAGDVYNSLADNEAYDAAIVAGTAGYVTWDGIRAAIVGVINRYEDAYETAYDALYDAEDVRNEAGYVLNVAQDARDNLENLDNDGQIDASFFGGMLTLTHDGEYVDTIELTGDQTLVLTGEDVNGDVYMKKGATVANIVFDGTVSANDFDLYQDGSEGNALDTINVTSSTIESLSLWTYNAAQVNIDIDTAGAVDLYLDSVDVDVAAVIDASASTSDLNVYTDQQDIASITTGSGDDTVTWDAEGVPNDLTIVTGAGSDTVVFDNVLPQSGTLTVELGTDNDTFDGSDMLLTDFAPEITKVDGGAGTDTLMVLMEGFQTEESYIRLTEDFTNFETLVLTQYDDVVNNYSDGLDPVEIDASKLANFTRFVLNGYNDYNDEGPVVFTNVLSTQTVSTQFDWYDGNGGGAVNVTAQGYDVAGADVADINAEHITPVNGGYTHTDWEIYGDNATLSISNNSVEDDEQGAEVEVSGDVATLTLNLDGGFTSGDGYAEVYLYAQDDNFANLTSVTVNGEGASYASISNYDGAALATINATGMDATGLTSDSGWDSDFYYYTENASVVESIQLGDAVDYIGIGYITDGDNNTVYGSNRGNMDTITGFDFENDYVYAGGEDFTLVAEADLVGSTLATILQNLATDTAVDAFVFQYKGDTYLYNDVEQGVTADTMSSNDLLIKIVGTAGMEDAGYEGNWVDWIAAV
ncbi:hypothetical protein B9Z47_02650 [Limnohabitans sp. 2KL-1]|uniref:DUF4214 domain-containing protein n=1 Tax=Limnohabitans sp. 2KL-1 TaxID=1100699 RepID=UPI000D35FBA2|nr:DUF4214 domain-containing protein [Limnohabitans sp. 2KL-1]PUE50667.1 hypothetical protein B9Z47_02650 [Limnohabitans sp. 2KL-1]